MKTILNPPRETWDSLCRRPQKDESSVSFTVTGILNHVRKEGDAALKYFSKHYDRYSPDVLKVPVHKIEQSVDKVPGELKSAIRIAADNIGNFHRSQLITEPVIETLPGVKCWRKSIPLERAGLYIPGGSAPLFSSVLMLGIPAQIAGCSRVIMCTPPGKNGTIDPLILYCAKLSGISEIFMAGGAQAIAAMAFGTESVPRVDKIFGPGNRYVTKAKQMIQAEGIAIDMPAGPSEVLIIAGANADPSFIASDLLAQAEHGPDSHVVLLTCDRDLIDKVIACVEDQLKELPRKGFASASLEESMAILLHSPEECVDFSNKYAPEHLIINTVNSQEIAGMVRNAGSVFIGKYSCESAGDYASGTNHTLPTNGFAVSYSGVSVESFMKKVTFQELSREGLELLGPVIERMAEAEQLHAHSKAVSIRLKDSQDV